MASPEEDEEDYMSDAFLSKIVDTRPGLSKGNGRKRKSNDGPRPSKSTPTVKSVKVLQTEKLQEGLKTSLGSDNKGSKMLEKMGFKKGMNLGKKGDGRSEPVPIELKSGRTGLGLEAHRKRKQDQAVIAQAWRAKQRQKMEATFRERLTGRNIDKQFEKDLYKSQKACQHLDDAKGLEGPVIAFYWPNGWDRLVEDEEEDVEEEKEEEEEEEMETSEKLTALTAYLREEHFYCIWCGTAYNDGDDLESNCPGGTAADHDD